MELVKIDEPVKNSSYQKKIEPLIDRVKKEKLTVILVTNLLEDIRYAENILVISKGKIIFNDKKSKLSKKIIERAGIDA